MISLSREDKFLMRRVWLLAFPAIVESLLVSMVQYVDTAMVGSLGPDATAAVAASTPVMWMLNSTVQAVAVGGTVTVAQAIGAGEHEKSEACFRSGFFCIVRHFSVHLQFSYVSGPSDTGVYGTEPEIHEKVQPPTYALQHLACRFSAFRWFPLEYCAAPEIPVRR